MAVISPSKKWKESQENIASELRAPRKIIGWLIFATFLNTVMIGYLVWLLNT